MFCKNCGNQIKEGVKFCGNCGTPVRTFEASNNTSPVPAPQNDNPHLSIGNNGNVIFECKITDSNFNLTDAGGKYLTASAVFKKSVASDIIVSALLGPLTAISFMIQAKVFKDKIFFIRLNLLAKPTEHQLKIHGTQIASVEMANAFMDKSITINTHSKEKINFTPPKKHRENIFKLLNEMVNK